VEVTQVVEAFVRAPPLHPAWVVEGRGPVHEPVVAQLSGRPVLQARILPYHHRYIVLPPRNPRFAVPAAGRGGDRAGWTQQSSQAYTRTHQTHPGQREPDTRRGCYSRMSARRASVPADWRGERWTGMTVSSAMARAPSAMAQAPARTPG